jgi:hypothetical protein
LIVSSSFGFATVDALIGQSGMQAALVLLGYNIEQQIKKIYKRKIAKKLPSKFEHMLAGFVADIRLWVYLLFAWALHVAIWGIPGVTGFGIGGKYNLLQKQLEACVDTEPKMTIPDAVTWIYWLQYLFFTSFGIVCSFHVFWVKFSFNFHDVNTKRQTPMELSNAFERLTKLQWNVISCLYAILSVSAKTALEAGLVMYVNMYEEWTELPAAKITQHAMQNETCFAIKP